MIKELTQEGPARVECLIVRCERNKTNKDTPYLSLTLEDASGTLDAKFWNLTEDMVEKYHTGMVVDAQGDILFHKNAIQLRVRKLIPLEDRDITEFVRAAPMSRKDMEEEITETVLNMKNEIIQSVVMEVLDQKGDAFYTYPAATRNHHNYVGGLAFHTLSMLRMAKHTVCEYPQLDADLLYGGVILHDIGKTEELSQAVLPEYTAKGNLLGHISIMSSYLDGVFCRLNVQDSEEAMLLKHMVLSHHGKTEYGSPVMPMIPEAEVLYLLDNLDARLFMMHKSIEATSPGSFGPRNFALENRMMYRRKTK